MGIYGIRQFMTRGEYPSAKSASFKYLFKEYQDEKLVVYEGFKSYVVPHMKLSTDNMYIQYVCGLYGVEQIFWLAPPDENSTLAVGAFIIDGEFDLSMYKEIV